MNKVTVIDSIMGTGKTSFAIQRMNETHELQKFIYVTPYLKEVERIKKSVKSRTLHEPVKRGRSTKGAHFNSLINHGHDIVTTHDLFNRIDESTIKLLEEQNYSLIIDEAIQFVEVADLKKEDFNRLKNNGDIKIDEKTKLVIWTGEKDTGTRFSDIYALTQSKSLYYVRDRFLVWTFPHNVLQLFKDVTLMTYYFKGTQTKAYFDLHEIEYELKSVINDNDKYKLIDYDNTSENREHFYNLMNIDDKESRHKIDLTLSYTSILELQKGYEAGNKEDIKTVREIEKNVRNFLDSREKGTGAYWSTFKKGFEFIKPKGYSQQKKQISINERATNEYSDGGAMAYICNKFMNVEELAFFQDSDIKVNQDAYAVSELLQWIFRSRIRNGEEVALYIPSKRMRDLLEKWANYEI